jgi:hypothetical protein
MTLRWPNPYLLLAISFAAFVFAISYLTYNEFFGGADEGCYTSMGYLLAHGQGFMPRDPLVARVAAYTDPQPFLPEPYVVDDPRTGRIRAQWFKGYPLLTAPLWRLFGYAGHKLWNPLAAAALLLFSFLILSDLGLAAAGLAAALLLGTSWLFLWYARYPMSEMSSAALTMLAALLFLRHRLHGGRWHLWLASGLVGLAVWVHIANLTLLPAFLVWLIWSLRCRPFDLPASPRRARLHLLSNLLLTCLPLLLFALYLLLDPGTYARTPIGPRATPSELAAVSSTNLFSWDAQGVLAQYHIPNAAGTPYLSVLNARFLPWLVVWNLLVPLPATLLSLAGLCLALRDQTWRPLWLGFIASGLCVLLMLASRGIGNPHVLYAGRRFVPLILPAACLLAGLRVGVLLARLSRRGTALVWLGVVGLAAGQFSTHVAFYYLRMGNGMHALAQDISRTVGEEGPRDQALVVLDAYPGQLSSGLRYVEEVPIVVSARMAYAELRRVLEHELRQGTRVYLLTEGKIVPRLAASGFRMRPVLHRDVLWQDPNGADTYSFPSQGSMTLRLDLIRVSGQGQSQTAWPKLAAP